MLREAARKDVYPALHARYGAEAFDEMVTGLEVARLLTGLDSLPQDGDLG